MSKDLFFSIVVPAHDEEKYIAETLRHLQELDYPKKLYEVIVVENGSTDKTIDAAKKFESNYTPNSAPFKILSFTQKGVAFARNRGIEAINPKADWVLFFDADTLVKPSCLRELEAFLLRPESAKYSMGTGSIKPMPRSLIGRFYFLWQDGLHYLTKTAYGAFLIVRKDVLEKHRFDESLSITEDGEICISARAKGKFFFLNTSSVSTSTRRFDKLGWLGTLLWSVGVACMPLEKRRKVVYKVIR